jgi:hypothetical protein
MYFITAIYRETTLGEYRESRCFGYYELALDAIRAVVGNRGDIQESLYNYAVIEKLGEGIHPSPDKEVWFEWDEDDNSWSPTDKPDWSKGITNWCLG